MLERQRLLVRDDGDKGCVIVDASTEVPLGSARWSTVWPWWLLFSTVLEVHEAGDAPLLFTVKRSWPFLPRYEICDADGQPVGSLVGPVIKGRYGRPLAMLWTDGAYHDINGSIVARLSHEKAGVEVSFSEAVQENPLTKMLLLAAVLQR
jgi:hypothetical protein